MSFRAQTKEEKNINILSPSSSVKNLISHLPHIQTSIIHVADRKHPFKVKCILHIKKYKYKKSGEYKPQVQTQSYYKILPTCSNQKKRLSCHFYGFVSQTLTYLNSHIRVTCNTYTYTYT